MAASSPLGAPLGPDLEDSRIGERASLLLRLQMPQGSISWWATMSMYWSIRIGVSTAPDTEGIRRPGYWWLTGHARRALVPWSGDPGRIGIIGRVWRRR